MRIALAQLNPVVGDVAGNTALVLEAMAQAKRERADVLVTSELVLVGYPPRDLLLREGVVEACEAAVHRIAQAAGDVFVIVGHPRRCAGGTRPLRNSASVCHRGKVIALCDKQLLPGYDVFDEDRYFEPGGRSFVVEMAGRRVGVVICEDLWRAEDVSAERRYAVEPVAELAAQDCQVIVSLNASPFVVGKWQRHLEQMREVATDYHVPLIAVNQVGANDDLVFDGRSIVVDRGGRVTTVLNGFASEVRTVELPADHAHGVHATDTDAGEEVKRWNERPREVFHALTLGVRDYVGKTGHKKLLLGLSGGIDSALAAVIASAAIGPKNVEGVMMPSRYSSKGSIEDSIDLAKRLGLGKCEQIPINIAHEAMHETLRSNLGEACAGGITDENVQARLRGVILMAMSNALPGSLLLSTSNKSEIATGYSTLYGDMCGAIALLGDLTKTRIYELARWINKNHRECGFAKAPIPESSLAKAPSAELRPNQTDQDTLPPYEILDQIVERFIEREQSEQTIIDETGFDGELVRTTVAMIDRAQFKRDQAPVIPKVTPRAFGRGRPMPIVMKGEVSGVRGQVSGRSEERSAISDQPGAIQDGAPSKGQGSRSRVRKLTAER